MPKRLAEDAPTPATSPRSSRRWLRLAELILLVVGTDTLTKGWADDRLASRAPIPVMGTLLRLRLRHNSGVAFGLFARGGQWWLVLTGFLALGVMAWWLSQPRGALAAAPTWALGLLLGGGLANLANRVTEGRVTDFIDVGLGIDRWPTFNLADVCITLGIIGVLLQLLWPLPGDQEG